MFLPRAKRDRQKERSVCLQKEGEEDCFPIFVCFAVLLITCCLVIKSTHTSLLLPHHCPPAVFITGSPHINRLPDLPISILLMLLRGPLVKEEATSRLQDFRQHKFETPGSCLTAGTKLFCLGGVTDSDKPFVLITGIDYFK